jgi:hypothetical protein
LNTLLVRRTNPSICCRVLLSWLVSFLNLGHANKKCGTVSVLLHSHLFVSAMLILLRYVLSVGNFVLPHGLGPSAARMSL